ncbi:MAG: RNA polymerase sigma factor [Thermotaleaceae bacterium]
MEISDIHLIRLCKDNHRDGYNLFYQKYEKYIYRLCYYYTHSKEDALDLMQEIYIKVFRSFHRFEEDKPLLPWLKRITINTCLNFLRSQGKKEISLHMSIDENETPLESVIASPADVEQQLNYLDTKAAIAKAIRTLPEDMKTAIILRHVEGMSYKEIGEIMDLPIGTVKTYLFRGRRQLMDKLKNEGLWEV